MIFFFSSCDISYRRTEECGKDSIICFTWDPLYLRLHFLYPPTISSISFLYIKSDTMPDDYAKIFPSSDIPKDERWLTATLASRLRSQSPFRYNKEKLVAVPWFHLDIETKFPRPRISMLVGTTQKIIVYRDNRCIFPYLRRSKIELIEITLRCFHPRRKFPF